MATIDIEGLLNQGAGGRGLENAHSAIDGAIEENELNSVLAPLLKKIDKTAYEAEEGLEPIIDYLMPGQESKYSDMAAMLRLMPMLGAIPERTITDTAEGIEGMVPRGLHGLEHMFKGGANMIKDMMQGLGNRIVEGPSNIRELEKLLLQLQSEGMQTYWEEFGYPKQEIPEAPKLEIVPQEFRRPPIDFKREGNLGYKKPFKSKYGNLK